MIQDTNFRVALSTYSTLGFSTGTNPALCRHCVCANPVKINAQIYSFDQLGHGMVLSASHQAKKTFGRIEIAIGQPNMQDTQQQLSDLRVLGSCLTTLVFRPGTNRQSPVGGCQNLRLLPRSAGEQKGKKQKARPPAAREAGRGAGPSGTEPSAVLTHTDLVSDRCRSEQPPSTPACTCDIIPLLHQQIGKWKDYAQCFALIWAPSLHITVELVHSGPKSARNVAKSILIL